MILITIAKISFSSFDEGIQFTEALAENVTLQSLGLDVSQKFV